MQGASPAAPTMAAITVSTRSSDAIISRASGASRTSVESPLSFKLWARMRACGALAMTAYDGLKRRHWASINSVCVAALSAKTSNRSG